MRLVRLNDIRHDAGHCYVADLVGFPKGENSSSQFRSKLMLFENEGQLGPSSASHQVIRNHGAGAYSHWEDSLYFSTSDNESPLYSGREYFCLINDESSDEGVNGSNRTSSLNIVMYGNINNLPLIFAIALREKGHNVRLIINRNELLHRPEGLYPHWKDAYPEWIVDCSDVTDQDIFYETPAIDETLRHLTRPADLAILNDTGPSFSIYLKCPHISLLTGSDLEYYGSFDTVNKLTSVWDTQFKQTPRARRYIKKCTEFIARQRDGVACSDLIWSSHPGLIPEYTQILDELGIPKHLCVATHFSNTIDLVPYLKPKNNRLVIFNGARINFLADAHSQFSGLDLKGTDILLHGFATYIKSGGNGLLRMVRKGKDVDQALKLIDQLQLSQYIEWLDESSLFYFYKYVEGADLVCDQLGDTSIPGAVTFDAYALGKPVLANFRNSEMMELGRFPVKLPGFEARNAEQVASCLSAIEFNHDLLAEVGDDSRNFAETYLAPKVVVQTMLDKWNELKRS